MDAIPSVGGTSNNLHRSYPNIPQAIHLLLLGWLLLVLISIPIVLLEKASGVPFTKHPATDAFMSLIALGLLLLLGLKKTRASFQNVFPMAPIRLAFLLPMSLTVLGLGILLSEVDNFFRTILPAPQWISDVFAKLMQTDKRLWGSILALVIVPPLTEELLFRGLILRGFLSRYTVNKAVVASAILFGVFHLIPWQILGATVWGFLFGWWFVTTHSLLPCLFGHALANAFPLLISNLPLEIQGMTGAVADRVQFQPLWLDSFGLVLAGVGLWLLVRMFRSEKNVSRADGHASQLQQDSCRTQDE